MIYVMDVGNTNIKNGLYIDNKLEHSWRIDSDRNRTADELGILILAFFRHVAQDIEDVEGIIVSSVIPSMNYTIEHMCKLYFNQKPAFVGPGMKTGIHLRYENPKELGADRICNAVGAFSLYQKACITVDFGTATSFGAISSTGDFLGGVIVPGVKIAAEALVEKTAKLPKVELIKPQTIIGKNTVHCIQSGLVYGYIGQVDYIIEKMLEELYEDHVKLIATGGMANLVVGESRYLKDVHSTLSFEGLRKIYQINHMGQETMKAKRK